MDSLLMGYLVRACQIEVLILDTQLKSIPIFMYFGQLVNFLIAVKEHVTMLPYSINHLHKP